MKKFDIVEASRELRYEDRYEIKAGCTLSQTDINPIILESYDTREEALEELKAYGSSFGEVNGHSGIYYLVYEYYVEEVVTDEDGERIDWVNGKWVGGDGILEYSEMKIELVDKRSYETLRTFDNMKDAEEALYDYDGEAYLSCEGRMPAPIHIVRLSK